MAWCQRGSNAVEGSIDIVNNEFTERHRYNTQQCQMSMAGNIVVLLKVREREWEKGDQYESENKHTSDDVLKCNATKRTIDGGN